MGTPGFEKGVDRPFVALLWLPLARLLGALPTARTCGRPRRRAHPEHKRLTLGRTRRHVQRGNRPAETGTMAMAGKRRLPNSGSGQAEQLSA